MSAAPVLDQQLVTNNGVTNRVIQQAPADDQLLPGPHVTGSVWPLTFVPVKDGIQSLGLSENKLELYIIKVEFDNGRRATFRCESTNLKTAFKMIETFGQQIGKIQKQTPDDADYQRLRNSLQGKTIWVDVKKHGHKLTRQDETTAFKSNSQGNALEYAFTTTPTIRLSRQALNEIKDLARRHSTTRDEAENKDKLTLQVRRVDDSTPATPTPPANPTS